MSPIVMEQLDPQPFRDWVDERLGENAEDEATVKQLAFDLGLGDRKLLRWRKENRHLERIEVEEALHHADVQFWEVYPDLELKVPSPDNPSWFVSKLSDEQVLELHAINVAGASVREIARRIWVKAGYKSAEAAAFGIRTGFRRLGLKSVVRHPTHLATVPQCGLPTGAGTPCRNIPMAGRDLCWTHSFPEAARESALHAAEVKLSVPA
jgi:hypothetical protein